MKKFIVLLVALCVASTAFAADFNWSYDLGFGWASNFDDFYSEKVDEAELGLSVDIDEFNSFSTEIDALAPGATIAVDSFSLTTDMGAYLGLPVAVTWENGFSDPGDTEYAGVDATSLSDDPMGVFGFANDEVYTKVMVDADSVWFSVTADWNLGSEDAAAGFEKSVILQAGSVDAVEGLSVGVAYEMSSDEGGTPDAASVFGISGAYAYGMDALMLTVDGSFATDSETDYSQYGAGLKVAYDVDDMTAVYASAGYKAGTTDADADVSVVGAGAGATYGDFGADLAYENDLENEVLNFIDASAFINIGAAKFRLGYVTTEFIASPSTGYGDDNNALASVLEDDSSFYMNIECDF